LQNVIERAVILSDDGVLPNLLDQPIGQSPSQAMTVTEPQPGFKAVEQALILQALQSSDWIIGGAGGAAAKLGLKRTTLLSKLKKLGITRPGQRDSSATKPYDDEMAATGPVSNGKSSGIWLPAE
jgi:transcriptional regulator of acetoin/glycerol metabolism